MRGVALCLLLLAASAAGKHVRILGDAPALAVASLSPNFGTVDGGTHVTVVGTGFDTSATNATCRLYGDNGLVYGEGPHFVPGKVVNETMMTCTTDSFPCAAYVHLEVSMDGTTFSTSNVLYNYVRFVDVSPGRSLFTCGSGDLDDTSLDVLVKLHPLLGSLASNALQVQHIDPALRRLTGIAGAARPSSLRHDEHDYSSGDPVTITVAVRDEHGASVATQSLPADGRVHRVSVTPSALNVTCPSMAAKLSVEATCTGCPTITRPFNMTVLPYKANQVAVDYGSHAVVAGRAPFAMYGWLANGNAPGAVLERRLEDMARRGVNTLMTYVCDGFPDSCININSIKYFLDLGQRVGIRMQVDVLALVRTIIANETDANMQRLTDTVNIIKDHPALLGYYISDDTITLSRSILADIYAAVKAADPYHPTFNTVSGSGNAWEYQSPRPAFDVAQYEEYDLNQPYYSLPTIPTDWPMTWVAQGNCGQGYVDDGTTARSARLQAYINLLGSGTSVMLWDWWQWTHYVSQTLIASHMNTRAEINALAPGLLSGPVSNPVIAINNTCSPVPDRGGPVIGKAFERADGGVYIVTANMDRSPCPFTLTASFLPAVGNYTLQVLFDDYTVSLTSNNFTSYLDGFNTRIYLWVPPAPAAASAEGSHVPVSTLARRLSTSMVQNPSMEESNSPMYINQWSHKFGYIGDTYNMYNFAMYQDSTVAHSGVASMRVMAPGVEEATPPIAFVAMPVGTIRPSHNYNWTAMVRVSQPPPSESFTVSLAYTHAMNYPIVLQGVLCSATFTEADAYQWRQLTCLDGVGNGDAVFGIAIEGTGAVWLDDVNVFEV